MICFPLLLLGDCDEMRLLGVSHEAYTANKHSMEGQNQIGSVPRTMLMNLLEPHHFGAVNLAVCAFIIAFYGTIIDAGLSNFFRFLLIVMAGLTGLAVTNAKIAVVLTLLSHIITFHTDFLSAHIELTL